MNRIHIAAVLLLLSSLLTMCREGDLGEVDFIALSTPEVLSLGEAAGEMTIEVKTANPTWSFVKKGDWLTVTKSGEGLTLTVEENRSPVERGGEILILSGTASKKISITQEAAPLVLDSTQSDDEGVSDSFALSADSVIMRHTARSFVIEVTGTITDWEAESDASWISLTSNPRAGVVEVTVEENPNYEMRVGAIYFTIGGSAAIGAFVVRQEGVPHYILPSLDFLTDNIGVRQFEFARGSALSAGPDGMFNMNQWAYQTDGDLFGSITYYIFNDAAPGDYGSDLEYYKRAIVFARDKALFADRREREGMRQFLLSEGFVWDEDMGWFINTTRGVVARIMTTGDARVIYECRPEQPTPMETITDLSLSNLEATTRDEMLAWEAAHGGILNEEASSIGKVWTDEDQYWFEVGKDGLVGRFYAVNAKSGAIVRRNYQYDTKSLALFEYGGSDFLTNEFFLKARSEGFLYDGEISHRVFQFTNIAKRVYLYVLVAPSGNIALQAEPLA